MTVGTDPPAELRRAVLLEAVRPLADGAPEATDETFVVALFNANNATITTSTGTAAIADNAP